MIEGSIFLRGKPIYYGLLLYFCFVVNLAGECCWVFLSYQMTLLEEKKTHIK